jgi:hypothetical protein
MLDIRSALRIGEIEPFLDPKNERYRANKGRVRPPL